MQSFMKSPGSRTTTLIISNEEIEESGLLIKVVCETTENEAKQKLNF